MLYEGCSPEKIHSMTVVRPSHAVLTNVVRIPQQQVVLPFWILGEHFHGYRYLPVQN